MTSSAHALFHLGLHAALADGTISLGERQILEGFALALPEPRPSLRQIEADLRTRRLATAELVRPLTTPAERQSAYEMCATVCAADGPPTPSEQWFLSELRTELGLEPAASRDTDAQVRTVTTPLPTGNANGTSTASSSALTAPTVAVDPAALDRTILNHALLAGGLELLPDTLATMAILPVQMRLVYQMGKAHGVELDRGHLQEFLGVIGVGVASQVIERYAVRMLGGLAGRFLGGWGRGLTGQATSSAMSFATTYALGQAARQYYAGGRKLGAVELKQLFQGLLPEAQRLQAGQQAQILRQSASLRGTDLATLARSL
jgi:uncharacterized protein (DUF697 family)/tellurite resistance protein